MSAIKNLLSHFDRYLSLDGNESQALTGRLTERKIKRKQYLLQEGDICKYFTYVVEGCFKMYGVDKSGTEHNLLFAPTNRDRTPAIHDLKIVIVLME